LRFPFLASKIEQSTIESLSLRFTIYISGEYYGEESFVHEAGIGSGCLNPFLMLLRGRSARRRMINAFFFVLSQVSHISCCGGASSRNQQRHYCTKRGEERTDHVLHRRGALFVAQVFWPVIAP
jgi:hypothetical protein